MAQSYRGEFDLVLRAVDYVEGELAKNVLESAGIPALVHGPDFDMAEMGRASNAQVRGSDVLVPQGTRARAREILVAAWGEETVARHDPAA